MYNPYNNQFYNQSMLQPRYPQPIEPQPIIPKPMGLNGKVVDSIKSLDYMMASVYDFVCMLEEDAKSDEEIDIIRKYARKISEL